MKKRISLLLILAICFSAVLSGCGCDHQWAEATCTTPKTCTLCEKTEGEALGHNKGEWETGVEATIFSAGTRIRPCTNCGMALTTERYELVKYFEGDKFLFSPAEFTQKYQDFAGKLASNVKAEGMDNEGEYALVFSLANEKLCAVFSKEEVAVKTSEKDERGINQLAVVFTAETAVNDAEGVAEAIIIYFLSLDPSLSVEDAGLMTTTIFNGIAYNSEKISVVNKNGLVHTLTVDDNATFYLITSIETK